MSKGDSLGDRIKSYEESFKHILPKRMPVIIRVDGRAFHTLTRPCKKPFDDNLITLMNDTAQHLCENIQGAQIAYVQSDEISILLHNYKKLTSQSWFNNELQKMVSISGAIASSFFTANSHKVFGTIKLATFDSRAFVLPESEVCNYFLWRQQDNTRNSIQMLARSLYSHKECNNKNCSQLQEMTFQKGHNWNDLPTVYKRGRCLVKSQIVKDGNVRTAWIVDKEIPIFSQDRNYINNLLKTEET